MGGHGGPGKPGSRPHHHGHKQQQQHDAHTHAKQVQKQQKQQQHAKPGRKHVKGAHRVHADAAAGDDVEVLGFSEEYYNEGDEVQAEVQGEEMQVSLQGARLGSSWKPPGVAGAQRGSTRALPRGKRGATPGWVGGSVF